jgi:ECF sigma factor
MPDKAGPCRPSGRYFWIDERNWPVWIDYSGAARDRELAGRIDRIDDEDGILTILRRIIADKVSARRAQMRALKRDRTRIRRWMSGIVVVLSAWDGDDDEKRSRIGDDVDLFQTGVPPAEVRLMADENLARLMDALDPELQTIARLRLRYTIPEAARRAGISVRSFNRRLAAIREIWKASGLVDEDIS